MLVLTRKQQQQIQIGDSITVTILSVRGGRVQVGVTAPTHMRVLRGELSPHEGGAAGTQARPATPGAAPHSVHSTASGAMRAPEGVYRSDPGRRNTSSSGAEPAAAHPGPQTNATTRSSPLARAVAQRRSAPQVRPPQRLGAASLGWLTTPRSCG